MSDQRRAILRVVRYAFTASGTAALALRVGSILASAGVLAALVGWFGGWRAAIVVLVLGFLALIAVTAAYRLARALDRYEQEPQVFLVFTDTEVAPAQYMAIARSGVAGAPSVTATGESYVVQTDDTPFTFARLRVANDPPPGRRGEKAERVAARIVFHNDEGRELLRMDGRWAETTQLAERSSLSISLEGAVLDIDSNGISHPLDIAMKRPGEDDIFAYNDENAHGDRLGLEKHRLRGDRFTVRVTLRPANADAVMGDFVLTNGGSSGTLGLDFADAAPATAR